MDHCYGTAQVHYLELKHRHNFVPPLSYRFLSPNCSYESIVPPVITTGQSNLSTSAHQRISVGRLFLPKVPRGQVTRDDPSRDSERLEYRQSWAQGLRTSVVSADEDFPMNTWHGRPIVITSFSPFWNNSPS